MKIKSVVVDAYHGFSSLLLLCLISFLSVKIRLKPQSSEAEVASCWIRDINRSLYLTQLANFSVSNDFKKKWALISKSCGFVFKEFRDGG